MLLLLLLPTSVIFPDSRKPAKRTPIAGPMLLYNAESFPTCAIRNDSSSVQSNALTRCTIANHIRWNANPIYVWHVSTIKKVPQRLISFYRPWSACKVLTASHNMDHSSRSQVYENAQTMRIAWTVVAVVVGVSCGTHYKMIFRLLYPWFHHVIILPNVQLHEE